MAIYYPQALINLRVLLEDFSTASVRLQKPYEWSVIPKNININLNSYTEADTFKATIDYKNLPFDPRIIRSCGVTIYLDNHKKTLDENGKARPFTPSRENVIFSGFADTDRLELSESDRTVTLEGRDFTALLIDREYLGEPINNSDRVDVVITKLLEQLPQTKVEGDRIGLSVQLAEGLEPGDIPKLASVAAGKGELDGKSNARKKRSYWDKIQEIVSNAGLICYVSIDKLILTKPRNLYSRAQAKAFVYGSNISSLEFERKLGRQKGFNIRVVSTAFEAKGIIEAKIPEEATAQWCRDTGVMRQAVMLPVVKAKSTGGDSKPNAGTSSVSDSATPAEETAPYITFRIANVINKEQLIKIGEKIYEELGRQQIEGKLSTKEMNIYSVNATKKAPTTEDPRAVVSDSVFPANLFRVGTPIEIRIDQGDISGISKLLPKTNRIHAAEDKKSADERRMQIKLFLVMRNYEPAIAEALAEALTRFDTPFFTKSVEFTLDHESGFSMDIDFINFVEIPQHLVEGSLS